MRVSINPSYLCNFSCKHCYLSPEQLKDKTCASLKSIENRLDEIRLDTTTLGVTDIELYGGELSALPDYYVETLIELCLTYTSNIHVVTNLYVVKDWMYDTSISLSVSYDFHLRERHEDVWGNMMELQRDFGVMILATTELMQNNVNLMSRAINQIPHATHVDIKPYSSSQSNQLVFSFREFENFIEEWIDSPLRIKLINRYVLDKSIHHTHNSFTEDHVYITPTGKFAMLEFDHSGDEFFVEVENVEAIQNWIQDERIKFGLNSICSVCDYFGRCATEHLRDVKHLQDSCSGLKLLLQRYENRLKETTENLPQAENRED